MGPRFDRAHTADLMRFLTASPSPYHAVAAAAAMLEAAGFRPVVETDTFPTEPGGRYLFRGGTLIAWWLPDGAPPYAPFRIIGSHTDSPNLRVKPRPDTGRVGWRQVAVEVYGGPLWNSWLDRDLGLSGRLALADGSHRLVHIDQPFLRIPQLAIHLNRSTNEGLTLDPQTHLSPVWGLGTPTDGELIGYVAKHAGVAADEVLGWDLMTHDVQPPALLGRDGELLAAGRMDNLVSVHASAAALAAVAGSATDFVPVLVANDHEEIGSQSDTGADGPLLLTVLRRVIHSRGGSYDDAARALAASQCLSVDMGHAVHPNYAEKHDPDHHPLPNGGPILKVNANQRYTTDASGRALFISLCEKAGVPWQVFVSNNRQPCGSTIGPLTASVTGIRTVDIGIPALSMHSARELCGADDPHQLASVLAAFYEE
ncbi:M18 family aminopeptidase [Fodinicola acaciae]|uniref:M18 family aminopeptidase n=1 Tax=Fodinicola acaciae TaxID=2681555 RepID=UPI0013D1ADB2|nr:M18 family aminopeptidase [Fodinicola acaciae]